MNGKERDKLSHELRNTLTILGLSLKLLAKYTRIVYNTYDKLIDIQSKLKKCMKCTNSVKNHTKS